MSVNSDVNAEPASLSYSATMPQIVVATTTQSGQTTTYYMVAKDQQLRIDPNQYRTGNYSANSTLGSELDSASDAEWDAMFAQSVDILERLAQEAHEEYLAGLAEDFDPDNDPDAPDDL